MPGSLGPVDDGRLRHGCWNVVIEGRGRAGTLRGNVLRITGVESVVGRRGLAKEIRATSWHV